MQKHVNLVDLVKSFPTNIYLQNLASIQKRTSTVKFAHLAEKSGKGSISNLSTKAITVDAAVDKLSFGRLQMVVFITAMTAHFSNSAFYELSIYVKPALASEFRYTELEHGELQAVGFAAQLAGAFLSSMLMDRIHISLFDPAG